MSVRTRILVPVALLITLCLVVLAAFVLASTRRNLERSLDGRVAGELQRHAPERRNAPPPTPSDVVPDTPLAFVRFTADGSVVQRQAAGDGQRAYPLPDTAALHRAALDAGARPFTIGGYRARAAQADGDLEVELGSLVPTDHEVDQQQRTLAVGSVVTILALVALVWLVLRRTLAPLTAMAGVAERVAGGDVDERAVPAGGREVDTLAHSFNRMVDELDDARRDAETSEARMRAFVADAGHELQTPVTVVTTYAELYRAGGVADDDLDQVMRRIGAASRRIGVLVDDLSLLATIDHGVAFRTTPVDLVELVTDAVSDVSVVDDQRRYVARVPDGSVVVTTDPDRVRQAVDNALRNVRVHTLPGTTAEVGVKVRDADVVIRIADDGPGMAPEERAVAWDRFRGSGRGSGLGLAITKAIVEHLGGTVALDASASGGLALVIALPR